MQKPVVSSRSKKTLKPPPNQEGNTETKSNELSNGSPIYVEYFDLTNKYQNKYGKNTVLLMQVGAFFEIYGLISHDNTSENKYTNDSEIYNVANICQLNIAEKKYLFKNKNLVMAGFRDHTLEKYLQKITENGFSVVVYVQEKNEKNTRRIFHSVHSAGTYVSYDIENITEKTNNIMCLWLDLYRPANCKKIKEKFSSPIVQTPSSKMLICGISVANTNTGKSFLFEYQTSFFMNPTTFDELERSISVYRPSELIIISPFEKEEINKIIQYSGIQTNVIHTFSSNNISEQEMVEKCTQQKYINHILATFYGEEAYQICSEFTTNIIATQSFCFLLNFIQEHNPNLVKSIKLPEFNNTTDRMVLANHTLKQLNIIGDSENTVYNSKLSSLLSFLNNCCSPMGKRKFQYQLLNPTFNEKWLEQEYQTTELFLDKYLDLLDPLRKYLSQIKDIEKIGRQFLLQKIYPSSIYHLYHSIIHVQSIFNLIEEKEQKNTFSVDEKIKKPAFIEESSPTLFPKNIKTTLTENISNLLCFIEKTLMVENCKDIYSTNVFEQNIHILDEGKAETKFKRIIREGVSPTLDLYYKKQENNINIICSIRDYLNHLLDKYLTETTSQKTPDEGSNYIKLHETEKMGFSFQITKKRAILLKTCLSKLTSSFISVVVFGEDDLPSKQNKQFNIFDEGISGTKNEFLETNLDGFSVACEGKYKRIQIFIKDIKFSNATTSNDEIEIPILNKICREIQTLKDKINKEIQKTFLQFITDFSILDGFSVACEDKLEDTDDVIEDNQPLKWLENIAEMAATIDVIQNKAYIANKYNYCRPIIYQNNSTDQNISFVDAVELRHALIEHIQQNEIYVTNDVCLGFSPDSSNEPKCNGILLYGINTSGKTSLIRALGISVIMAQAGIYVPCKKFTYKPYTAIYSRILGNDNLFKGLSTFAVEMSELRTILKSADNRSLVIGDELCSGTEIQSAISIFISGLIELYKKDCSFLFATHLHEIVNYEEIVKMQKLNAFSKSCENENTVSHEGEDKYAVSCEGILKIKHLSIHYDAALECIVYDRKLKDGSGSNNYGLTVCQSLYMPEEFMKTAYHIRSKYFPETSGELSHNPSKYNSQKIKGKCEICNIHIAEEIHHLREQNESNEKGFIDGFHKNHPANLSALCESCHLAMHRKSSYLSSQATEKPSKMNEKKVRKKTIRPPSSAVCSKETFESEYKLVSIS